MQVKIYTIKYSFEKKKITGKRVMVKVIKFFITVIKISPIPYVYTIQIVFAHLMILINLILHMCTNANVL